MYLHVADLGAERLEFGGRLQIARSAQRTANLERPVQRRVSRDLSRQVSAKQRIGIEMMEGQVQVRGKVVRLSRRSPNGQVGFIEVGVRLEIELASMGDRVDVEISGALLVEREILEMDVRFERRLIESAAGSHREIGDAIRREPAGLQAREAGEIEVTSGKIQAKLGFDASAFDVLMLDVLTATLPESGAP